MNFFSALEFIKRGRDKSVAGDTLFRDQESNVNNLRDTNDAFLASGSYDGTLMIWNLNKRVCVKTLRAHSPHRLSSIASSNDGLTLVSVGWDGNIKVNYILLHTHYLLPKNSKKKTIIKLIISTIINFSCGVVVHIILYPLFLETRDRSIV